jgi:hypothetical protein
VFRDETSLTSGGWTRFRTAGNLDDGWTPSIISMPSSLLSSMPDVDAPTVPSEHTPHPRSKLPGQFCVEIGYRDASTVYGKFVLRVLGNLPRWARSSPFHWRGMLAKVRAGCGGIIKRVCSCY